MKMIRFIIYFLTIAAYLAMPAYSSVQSEQYTRLTDSPLESFQVGISDAEYVKYFDDHYFYSVEELYQGLYDFNSDELQLISYKEKQYIEDTRIKTRVTMDELDIGMFANMRNRLRREETVMVPY